MRRSAHLNFRHKKTAMLSGAETARRNCCAVILSVDDGFCQIKLCYFLLIAFTIKQVLPIMANAAASAQNVVA